MPKQSDSNDEKWRYDLHTHIKHRILSYYLGAWTGILGSRYEALVYIDAFAGRGSYASGEQGSPLLAVDTAVQTMNKYPGKIKKIFFIFVEADRSNFTNLKALIATSPHKCDSRIECQLENDKVSMAR